VTPRNPRAARPRNTAAPPPRNSAAPPPRNTPAPPRTIAETLRLASGALGSKSESPRLDAELLLGAVLGLARTTLIARGTEPIAGDSWRAYRSLIERRMRGAPIAYLTGRREFWSMALKVTPAVLVPRPETEVLVEQAVRLLPRGEECTVLDLGTGSGAIALAIASERPRARVTGVDISPAALEVARDNARTLGLCRVAWRLGSWFDAVPGERFGMVVANPPYIGAADPALEALTAEPALALVGGPTGLEALAAIIATAGRHLEPHGWLLLEHGSGQGRDVAGLLERHGFSGVRSQDDYSGMTRVTLGTIHSPH
jgi:release factor glutamine methyltransferase